MTDGSEIRALACSRRGSVRPRAVQGSSVDTFLVTVFVCTGLVASLCRIQPVLRVPQEEQSPRARLLATPVSRLGWTLGHVLFAFSGPIQLPAVWVLPSLMIAALGLAGLMGIRRRDIG